MQKVDKFTREVPPPCMRIGPLGEAVCCTELMVEIRAPGEVKSALRAILPLHWFITWRGHRSAEDKTPLVTNKLARVAQASS
jgi:hypothetical protein